MRTTNANYRQTLAAVAVAIFAAALGCNRPTDLGPVAKATEAKEIRTKLSGEGGGESGAAVATGTGWATLKGTFTYDGAPPTMPPYDANKDMATCAPGGKPPAQEYLVVDSSSKGIANIAIYARTVSRVHDDSGPSTKEGLFDQKVCRFLTHVMGMSVGQPIVIRNSDNVGHNTKIEGQNSFNQTVSGDGGTVNWSPQKEEAIPAPVHCSIHPWMVAYMLPRKNQYFAVTAKDGSFEIKNLPAGEELEIQVWHESAAGSQGALIVEGDDAKALKWSKKGRIKVKLDENEVREIKIAVPASAFRAG